MYVVVEGIDTAGKSTQLDLLQQKHPNAIFTKEPGGTDIGLKLRSMALNGEAKSPIAEMFLFLADRAEHIKELVEPNYNKKMIISDRSAVSGVAYALVQGEIDSKELVSLNNFATNGIYPQKVFLLRLSKEELEYRLSQKELDGIELRGSEYLLKIQDALVEATRLLGIELVIIDAKREREDITQEILNNMNDSL